MTAARYEVLNTELKTGRVISKLPVTGISYTESLNASGAAQVGIPLDCPEANPDELFAGGSGLVVVRDDEPAWGGILWGLAADLAAGTLALSASGYHSHYKSRHFTGGLWIANMDIADAIPFYMTVSNGIGTDFSELRPTGRLRTRSWVASEWKVIAEAVEDLADDIGGFNFHYVPRWIERGKTVGHRFLISDRGGTDVQHVLEHTKNCNVTAVSYDGSSLATHAVAVGADNGAGEKLIGAAQNSGLIERIPSKRIVQTFSDIKETETLIRKAQAIVNAGAAPVALPTLTLYPDLFSPTEFVPGDLCSVTVNRGYIALSDEFVLTERKVDVDTNGRETVSLSLANAELFANGNPS